MKRIALTVAASALLLAPAAGAERRAPDPAAQRQQQQREILVRGVVLAVSPVSVRASIGSTVTCEVRNRELAAGLVVGDRVLMKCVGRDGRWILRRLAIRPTPSREPSRDRDVRATPAVPVVPGVPVAPARDGVKAQGS